MKDEIMCEASLAIQALTHRIKWRPQKGMAHLNKRKVLNHLPSSYTLNDYNQLIKSIISEPDNLIYLYIFGKDRYYGVVGKALETKWLVLFGSNGVMETAFPPDNISEYLEKRGFKLLGKIGEL